MTLGDDLHIPIPPRPATPDSGNSRVCRLQETGTTSNIVGIELVGGVGTPSSLRHPSTSSAKKMFCPALSWPCPGDCPTDAVLCGNSAKRQHPLFFLTKKIASRGWDHAMMMAMEQLKKNGLCRRIAGGKGSVVEVRLLVCWAWRPLYFLAKPKRQGLARCKPWADGNSFGGGCWVR
jgi:hypothetical protein